MDNKWLDKKINDIYTNKFHFVL